VSVENGVIKMDKSGNASFGAFFRERRKKAGKTLGDIADALGVSVSEVSDLECGKRSSFASWEDPGSVTMSKILKTPKEVLNARWVDDEPLLHVEICSGVLVTKSSEFEAKWATSSIGVGLVSVRNYAEWRHLLGEAGIYYLISKMEGIEAHVAPLFTSALDSPFGLVALKQEHYDVVSEALRNRLARLGNDDCDMVVEVLNWFKRGIRIALEGKHPALFCKWA